MLAWFVGGTASPLHLKATEKNAPTVKRVIVTSSFASIVHPKGGKWPGKVYRTTKRTESGHC